MKTLYYLLLTLLISSTLFPQSNLSIDLETGIGINNHLIIANRTVHNSNALLVGYHITYEYKFKKNLLIETSLFNLYSHNKGQIGESNFEVKRLKLGLDVVTGLNISDRIALLIGSSLSNGHDLKDLNLNRPDALRIDLLTKINYALTSKLLLSFRARTLLNRMGTQYLLSDPKHSFTIGLSYKLRKK